MPSFGGWNMLLIPPFRGTISTTIDVFFEEPEICSNLSHIKSMSPKNPIFPSSAELLRNQTPPRVRGPPRILREENFQKKKFFQTCSEKSVPIFRGKNTIQSWFNKVFFSSGKKITFSKLFGVISSRPANTYIPPISVFSLYIYIFVPEICSGCMLSTWIHSGVKRSYFTTAIRRCVDLMVFAILLFKTHGILEP